MRLWGGLAEETISMDFTARRRVDGRVQGATCVRARVISNGLLVLRTFSFKFGPAPRSSSRSVNPASPAANERADAPAWQPASPRDAITQLVARTGGVSLDDATRAHLRAQMTDAAALKRGRTIGPDDLLYDIVRDVPGLVDAILAGRVAGFSPAALRFTVELADALAGHRATRQQHDQARATASSQKALSTKEVLACRTELVTRTDTVLPGDAPERATLARAGKLPSRTLDRALGAVESTLAVASSVFARGEADPTDGAYHVAMGYTQTSLAAVVAPVQPALDARTAHREAMTSGGVTQQEIDRLEGRLYAQLFRLWERVAAARKRGEALPAVEATRMRTAKRGPKAVKAPEGAAAQPKATKRTKAPAAATVVATVVAANDAVEATDASLLDASG